METLQLNYPSPKAEKILWNPVIEKDGENYFATPLSQKDRQITFGLKKAREIQVNPIKKWLSALRAISLTVMFIPTLITYLVLTQAQLPLDRYAAVVSIIIPCFLLLSVNVLNDVRDHLKLIDLPDTIGGSGVIQKGWLTPKQLIFFAIFLILSSMVMAIPVLIGNLDLLTPIFVLTIMIVIGYSGKPFDFKYRALGDLVVFLACGPLLTLGYSLATTQSFNPTVTLLGTAFGLLACAILHANNINDIENDTSRGGKTLASVIGFSGSKKLMAFYYLGAFLALGASALNGISFLQLSPVLLAIWPVIKFNQKIFNAKNPLDKDIQSIRFIAPQLHLLIGVLLCFGIVFL